MAISEAERHEPELITPHIGSLYTTANISLFVHFPGDEWLGFERTQGYVEFGMVDGEYIARGHVVQEGDVIAYLAYNYERTEIYRDAAAQRLREFDQNTINERNRRLDEIANAEITLENACEETWPQFALHLAQLELAYERFNFTSRNARYPLAQALADLDTMLEGEYLIAPFDGVITFAVSRRYRMVPAGPHAFYKVYYPLNIAGWAAYWPGIFRISSPNDFVFIAQINSSAFAATPVPHANILRYGEILIVQGRHADGSPMRPVYAQVVSDSWRAGTRDDFTFWLRPLDAQGLIEYFRERDSYNYLLALSQVVLTIPQRIAVVDNGMLLPAAVVHREDAGRFVYIYEMGSVTKRYVVTGPTLSGYTQIISGLELDTKVVVAR